MPQKRLLVFGSAHMELSLSIPRFPGIGEQLKSEGSFRFTPGGRGAISAVTASRLGSSVLLCTRIGGDANGKVLKQYYETCGIDTRFIKIDRNRQTALCERITESGEKRRKLYFPGALDALCEEDLEDALSAFPDALLLHPDLGFRLFGAAAEQAKEQSIPVFADLTDAVFSYPEHAKPVWKAAILGEAECYAMTDIFPECLDDYVRACIRLSNRIRADYFILRLKGRGAFLTDGKYNQIISAPDHPGDRSAVPGAFAATLAHTYLKSGDLSLAARLAVAQDAYLSLYHDTFDVFPGEDELRSFAGDHHILD